MRLLVTGGTGFLGSHTVAALLQRGHEARILARTPGRVSGILEALDVDGPVDVAAGDMTDAASVRQALDGMDGVIHTAAQLDLGAADGEVNDANVEGVRNVIGQAVAARLDPIVHASSLAAYIPTDAGTLTPDAPLANPETAYGRSKLQGELLVRGWQDAGAPITTIVLGSIYGPISPHLEGSFLAVKAALETMMAVAPGGMGILDVRDAATMFANAAVPGAGPRILMANGHWVGWQDWVDLMSAVIGREIPTVELTLDAMVDMGRELDRQRADGAEIDLPLSEEAALTMASGRPMEDAATRYELAVDWRPTAETFRDAVAWLIEAGHLDPSLAPALGRTSVEPAANEQRGRGRAGRPAGAPVRD